jgi:TRAP-type C4-dicarboxylate transport system permease small subunit
VTTRLLEWAAIAAMLVLVLDVLAGVVWRFVLRRPLGWTDELATFLLIWVAMLGAALAHRDGTHLGVIWLAERLEPRVAAIVSKLVHAMVVLFAAIVMVYGGMMLVLDRFQAGQILPALGWARAWVYVGIPIAGVFIIFYSLRALVWPTPMLPASPQEQSDLTPPPAARPPREGLP